MSTKTHEEIDYDYTDVVPFYGTEYCIPKHARTADIDRLKKEPFEVMPLMFDLFFTTELTIWMLHTSVVMS